MMRVTAAILRTAAAVAYLRRYLDHFADAR